MHIVGLLLGLAATIGVILWRLNNAAEAAKGLAQTADDVGGMVRRARWRRKAGRDPLDLVDDSRIAAAAMMVATAQSDGAMTAAERTVILHEIMTTLGASSLQTAEEVLAQARWLVRDYNDLGNCLRKLMPVIQRKCGPAEKTDLARMLDAVADADGPARDNERDTLARLRRELVR